MFRVPERDRFLGDASHGNNGAFLFDSPEPGWMLFVIASDGEGWEHVSAHASTPNRGKLRTPTWREMQFLKDRFWGAEDTVVQFHPPKSDYVNCHPHCLHLWRPTTGDVLRPPIHLIGVLDGRASR